MTKKKTIIITGSLGQNGKILSRLLVEKGYQVIGVLFKNNKNKEKKVKYINLDLKNLKLLSKSINKFKPTHIIHFGSKNPSYEDKDNFYKENYVVAKNIIDSIKNIYKENIIVDFSHAEDICNAIYLIIKKNICIDKLILSSGKKTYINNIINYLLDKLLNIKKFKQKTKNNNNNNFIIGRNKLAKKILNWKAKKNIFIAINDMIDSHD